MKTSFLTVVWNLMRSNEKKNFVFLIILSSLLPLVEIFGIGTVFGFIDLTLNIENIDESFIYKKLQFYFFINDKDKVLFFGGILVIFFLIMRNCFVGLNLWLITKFGAYLSANLARRLISGYLKFSFSFFTKNNSAILLRNINSESQLLSTGYLIPILSIFSSALVFLGVSIVLIIYDPFVTLLIMVFFSLAYFLAYLFSKKKFKIIGNKRLQANKDRFRLTNQTINGIKEIKILSNESFFLKKCSKTFFDLADLSTKGTVFPQIPKLVFELILFGGIVSAITFLLLKTENTNTTSWIETMSLYLISAYRLMPYLDGFFRAISKVNLNLSAVNMISKHLLDAKQIMLKKKKNVKEIRFNKNIIFKNVGFHFNERNNQLLKKLNFEIKHGQSFALVGSTGAGKSTIVNLLLGLYEPIKGTILIDDVKLNQQNLRSWQTKIGYVPQDIYIIDDTIKNNIAFGVDPESIDSNKIIELSKLVKLHDFINNELPDNYETILGEKGITISGGQKQRLGIARALYHDPEIIIFDEATNSLDSITEKIVSETIYKLSKKKTLVIITHNISSIKKCDMINILDKGMIVAKGDYKKLMRTNKLFKKISMRYN